MQISPWPALQVQWAQQISPVNSSKIMAVHWMMNVQHYFIRQVAYMNPTNLSTSKAISRWFSLCLLLLSNHSQTGCKLLTAFKLCHRNKTCLQNEMGHKVTVLHWQNSIERFPTLDRLGNQINSINMTIYQSFAFLSQPSAYIDSLDVMP